VSYKTASSNPSWCLARKNLAGGACLLNGRPILENIAIEAVWAKRKKISFGKGILNAWLPDAKTGQFKKMAKTQKLVCQADEP
jgi:hypothetical protein